MKQILVILISLFFLAVGVYSINEANMKSIFASSPGYERTVILDAGHGGEDGGAVADDGTNEKDINLMIANDIACFFDLFGIDYIATRTEDKSLSDEGLDTIRKRKVSDITNRFSLINGKENSVLLSIHQNFFPQKQYSGTQVFYTKNVKDSAILAQTIQDKVRNSLQPNNTREIKPSGDSVYLLDKAKTTSVMVECGFISNDSELQELKDSTYQAKLSYFIFRGTLDFLSGEKDV